MPINLREIFKPRRDKFLELLAKQAALTVEGLGALKQYLSRHEPGAAKSVARIEEEADETRRILVEELMRTFVTPYDREDIFTLSREIDDILDYANTTVDEMEILEVVPTSYMGRMVSLLYDAAHELNLAILRMEEKHYTVANEHVQRAKALENRVETVYREALADLFRGPKNVKHVMVMLKVREIYRHLSNAADRIDQAANVIADIIMKSG